MTHLFDWRSLAPQASGALNADSALTQDLRSRLNESATCAAQAISDLSEEKPDVPADTKRALTVIAGACEQAGQLLGQLKAQPGGAAGG